MAEPIVATRRHNPADRVAYPHPTLRRGQRRYRIVQCLRAGAEVVAATLVPGERCSVTQPTGEVPLAVIHDGLARRWIALIWSPPLGVVYRGFNKRGEVRGVCV